MIDLATPEVWLVCGSQHLYGPGPLQQVAAHGREIAGAFAGSPKLPLKTEFKALLTTPDEIAKLCLEANSDPNCAGLILWMHTFSPSKMWVRGLNALQKPFVHLHTQFNRDLPWDTIDMDFMNLNQSAHGDREAGFIHTRMRLRAKSSSAIGPIRRSRTASAPGCARRAPGTIGRGRNSAVSATTCARWR